MTQLKLYGHPISGGDFGLPRPPLHPMTIQYQINTPISADQFIDVLRRSTLGERRPIDDRECMEGMVNNSNLLVTAWDGDQLVGVARSMTDFHYACYLSDLAVDQDYQRQGIGKQLQILTQQQLGKHCKLILIAAPAANAYYGRIGYTHMPRCWVLDGGSLGCRWSARNEATLRPSVSVTNG